MMGTKNLYMSVTLLVACVLAAFGVAGLILAHRAASASSARSDTWFTGTQWQREPKVFWAHDFKLPDQDRQLISLHQFRGQVVLLSFTSSVCRQQCPLVGRNLTTTERLLGRLSRHTILVNISVDPEADSEKAVGHFANEMGWQPYHWYYLWAPRARMKPVWRDYYVYVQAPPPIFKPGLQIIHLSALAMIDQAGRVRGYFAYPFLPRQIASGVRHLLGGT